MRGSPVYDSSGRTIAHIVWTFTIKETIATVPNTTTDDTVEGIRRILMKSGGVFVYSDKGFSDSFSVNTGVMRDVAFGPKPRSFTWKPLANRYAVEITWVVDVALPECANAFYHHAIAEANFKMDYHIDGTGHTTRVFSGHLRIAANKDGNRLTDNADLYRSKFVPVVPSGFRRTEQRFSLSEDKARLDVSITDTEMKSPNAPPPGIVDVSLKHTIANSSGADTVSWTQQIGTISARYTVARGQPPKIAVKHFVDVVKDRVTSLVKVPKIDEKVPQQIGAIMALSSSVTEEDAYGLNQVSCSYSYMITSSPTWFMTRGLWRPMKDNDWSVWAKSMSVLGERGYAGLKFANTDDAIIDLCLGGKPEFRGVIKPNPVPPPPDGGGVIFSVPPQKYSWLSIKTGLRLESQDRVMRHVPLESGEMNSTLRTPGAIQAGNSMFSRMAADEKGSDPPRFQRTAASMPFVIFEGSAIRAGYEILCPILKGAFGRVAIPANGPGFGFTQWTNPLSSAIPINFAKWRLRYMLSDETIQVGPAVPKQEDNQGPKRDSNWPGSGTSDMPLFPFGNYGGDIFK